MVQCRQFPRYVVVIGLPLLFVGFSALVFETFGEGPWLLVLGLFTTVLSAMHVWASLVKRRWPIASGIVTGVSVQTTPGLFGWRDTERDRAYIDFCYEVDGQKYHGEFSCHPTEDGVWRQLGGFPQEGAAIHVHYNRRHPSTSSLVPGPGSLAICFLLLGLAAIGTGVYVMTQPL